MLLALVASLFVFASCGDKAETETPKPAKTLTDAEKKAAADKKIADKKIADEKAAADKALEDAKNQ